MSSCLLCVIAWGRLRCFFGMSPAALLRYGFVRGRWTDRNARYGLPEILGLDACGCRAGCGLGIMAALESSLDGKSAKHQAWGIAIGEVFAGEL
jgi:hypothetical protein